jgi:hypothetical protein
LNFTKETQHQKQMLTHSFDGLVGFHFTDKTLKEVNSLILSGALFFSTKRMTMLQNH